MLKGSKHSKETKLKIGLARLGKHHSVETKNKISSTRKSIIFSDEYKENLRLSHLGKNGIDSSHWKGGRVIASGGYILVYSLGHPFANNDNYVREHRLVMEESLGRYLKPAEVIHHINGNKLDNRIENLMLFASDSEHHKYPLK